jgi:uncharacterized NAD-dependent epimerase/dehydratase family protein
MSLKFLAICDGKFGPISSKTANGAIRFTPERVAAVLDTQCRAKTAQEVLGYGGDIPVVHAFADGVAAGANALLIGIAPTGGQLPPTWRGWIREAIQSRMEIWSGLHFFIGDDPEFAELAAAHGTVIRDLRKPPADLPVSSGKVRELASTVILTVGSDCNMGKMTSQLELRSILKRRGQKVAFAGTGQTGILIEGWGIAVDAVIADFIGGAAERLTMDAAQAGDIVLVEGQGSIIHPGYSGVTFGLIHGSLPHAFVLCHQPSRKTIDNNPWVPLPPLKELVQMHEAVARPLRPAPVIGICLNTFDLPEQAARDAIKAAEDETGLPAADPVRFGAENVADAIERFHATRPR